MNDKQAVRGLVQIARSLIADKESALQTKIDKINQKAADEIASLILVELKKSLSELKQKFPFLSGTKLSVGMGSWSFRNSTKREFEELDTGDKFSVEIGDFLDTTIKDGLRTYSLESAAIHTQIDVNYLVFLIQSYEEVAAGERQI